MTYLRALRGFKFQPSPMAQRATTGMLAVHSHSSFGSGKYQSPGSFRDALSFRRRSLLVYLDGI